MTDSTNRDGCPAGETIREYADGNLAFPAAAGVERHLVSCAHCRSDLALYAQLRGEGELDPNEEALIDELASATRGDALSAPTRARVSGPSTVHRRVLPFRPLALAASVLLLATAAYWIAGSMTTSDLAHGEELLAAALADERPSAYRLSDAPYAPFKGVRGGEVRSAEAARVLLEEVANRDADVRALRALGRVQLAAGDSAAALETLRRASEISADDADLLVDLSVAAAETGNLAEARSRLEAILARDPNRVDALFNLALISERERRPEARSVWARYLAVDPSSPWSEEARRYLPDEPPDGP